MEIIRLENYSMSFGEGRFSLRGIDLTVSEGEFVVVCGRSGSGKSTLLRQMKREFAAKEYGGSARYCGIEVRDLDDVRSLETAYVMQSPEGQIVTDNVLHELCFALENAGMTTDDMLARAGEAALFFALTDKTGRSTAELSGGEKQLVNLAAAAAMKPRLLLLDEPCAQLDPVSASRLIGLVTKMCRELGTTVIMTEHRLDLVADVCDRLVVLDGGKIAADKPMREVVSADYDGLPLFMRAAERLGGRAASVRDVRKLISAEGRALRSIAREPRKGGEICVKCRGVRFRYTRKGADILRELDLDVEKGKITALYGGNGAGKSTLLKVICGELKPYSGRVRKEGRAVYLPQDVSWLFSADTVGRELAAIGGVDPALAATFGGGRLDGADPLDLSGGEKALLALMKAAACSPDILLLDEPVSGLDASAKKTVAEYLKSLAARGKAVVIVTHDCDLAAECADATYTLFDGRIVSAGDFFTLSAAARIARGYADGVTREEDLFYALGDQA